MYNAGECILYMHNNCKKTSKWVKITKCLQDAALRDIKRLNRKMSNK